MTSTVFQEDDLAHTAQGIAVIDDLRSRIPGAQAGASPSCFSGTLSNSEYHAQHAFISHSGMREILRSPAHYYEYLNSPRVESAPNLGAAAHAAIMEPEVFAQDYVVYEGYRKGKAWDEFKAQHGNKLILNITEDAAIKGMVAAVKAFEEYPLREALNIGEPEKSIFWMDEQTGVGCRIRVDNLTPYVIFDLKTIDDARPEKVARQVASMDYDLQAFMYTEGVRAYCGKHLPFYFVFIETSRPHGIWIHKAGRTVMSNGEIKFRRGVRAFRQLQDSGDWHGYKGAISELEMPRYAMLTPTEEDGLNSISV